MGKNVGPIDGIELVKKITSRAIRRLLCERLNVLSSDLDESSLEYQPIFTRNSKKKKCLRCVRLRFRSEDKFITVQGRDIKKLGVTARQFLDHLRENKASVVLPVTGSLYHAKY